jgi:uncharacterized membrane protein YphA (DoxX/SURF4 family)
MPGRLSDKLSGPVGRGAVLVARVAIAAVFVFAAVPKMLDPGAFAQAIDNYRLFPEWSVGMIAVVVPAVELTVAGALLLGIGARGGALVATLMLVGFTAVIVQAMTRGIDVECGCFGATTRADADWVAVARNALLLAGSILVAIAPDVPWRKRPAAPSEAPDPAA